MVHIIFEDHPNTPTSLLLKESIVGDLMYFAGGCRINNLLTDLYNTDDIFYIYLDLVPNNEETINNYYLINKIIRNENMSNVYIFPIICIEYIFLRSLIRYNISNELDIVFNSIASVIQTNSDNLTLEKLYKKELILLYTKYKCFKNKQNKKGYYYTMACKCSNTPTCRRDVADKSIPYKADYFYTTLYPFYIPDNMISYLSEVGIFTNPNLSIHGIYTNIQNFYDNVCDLLNVDRLVLEVFNEFNNIQ